MTLNLTGSLTGDMINDLSNVYIAFLSPSVIGSFSVLVVSIVKWSYLREQVHLLVQLALADLMASLILMLSSIMNKADTNKVIVFCLYSLPLCLAFYLISFLLVVIYAWKSKNAIQGWRESQSDHQTQCARKEKDSVLYACVWLVPLAFYFLYVLTNSEKMTPLTDRNVVIDDTYCTSCILFLHVFQYSCSEQEIAHGITIKVILFVAVIPVMVTCSVIYYKVGKWYEKHEQAGMFPAEGDGRLRRSSKRVIATARNMVLVILICWIPALVLIVLSALMEKINIEQRSLFWLYIIQAITVSLQGFLNSMVYAWRRPNFTEAVLGEHTPLISNSQAYFEESFCNYRTDSF